ncbi:cell division protein FtsW [Arthrobacter sp. RIT-PI-e]|uniref:putative lipid II flippase FtsW n=1 Tax=Arthrobacter sp. RIT-PI-e TaxID=1681197 RepID=UPI00067657F1|nr:putative lipid II flippase FtsW [Arthrobacter sp. RIT-PI-e]KNC17675.1 cell division protein FtsW [Arthrobacter sp. RIT-PI-e]
MVTTPTRPGGRKPSVRPVRVKEPVRPATPSTGPSGPSDGTGDAGLGARTIKAGGASAGDRRTNAGVEPVKGLRVRLRRGWAVLEGSDRSPSGFAYYLILGSALALTAIGLMMVLSASSVEAIAAGVNRYETFSRQAVFAGVGVVLMIVLSRLGPRALRALAWPSLLAAVVLLALVLVVGQEINGNKNWLQVGPLTLQPSEPAKLAVALWLAAVLERKKALIKDWKHALVPALPIGGLPVLLILVGGDLGTALIFLLIMAAALFFAGASMKLFTVTGLLAVVGSLVMVATSGNRNVRIAAWLGLNCDDGNDLCMQSDNGLFAMASGGWFGVGIGQSRQKWNWIPEAHNDFIVAIIGEEFGLLGTLVVVLLFGVLAVATFRVAMRYTDPFVRILMGSILVWLIGQAFVNIGMVTGLLPVIGVPLPFISYGGSALTFTLAAVGVLLSFARRSPRPPASAVLPSVPGRERVPS